tara:strand:- start:456 stop:860 length:405 start_codon:yes stop_codon:yes gene_type:complete
MNPILTFVGNVLTGGGVVTEVVKAGSSYLKGKVETKRVAIEADNSRKQELLRQGGSWDEIHARNSGNSWKDEFWTLVFAIPLVMCFIPSQVSYVVAGFAALEGMPEWYSYALGTLIAASVGFRKLTDVMGKRKT